MPLNLADIQQQVLELISDNSEDVTLNSLTQEVLNGSGVFDTLMRSMSLHLEKEHTANRITGDQYAQVYTTATLQVLEQSIAFLLGKERFKLERATTLLQLARIDKEIALTCQRLVTEKAQVMDQTILDPTADAATSQETGAGSGVYLFNTVQPVAGTTGRKNSTIERQIQAYQDDYKTKVANSLLDAHKVLLSNIIDIGVIPTELDNPSMDQLIEHLKVDCGIVAQNQVDTTIDSNRINYTNAQYPEA